MRICRTKLLTLFEKTRTFTDFMIKKSHRAPNGIQSDGGRKPIGRQTESDRTADGIRSDGGRNLIGRRTETDRAADGNRSGGGRKPIGRRTPSAPQTLTHHPDTEHSDTPIPPLNMYQDTMKGLYATCSS